MQMTYIELTDIVAIHKNIETKYQDPQFLIALHGKYNLRGPFTLSSYLDYIRIQPIARMGIN